MWQKTQWWIYHQYIPITSPLNHLKISPKSITMIIKITIIGVYMYIYIYIVYYDHCSEKIPLLHVIGSPRLPMFKQLMWPSFSRRAAALWPNLKETASAEPAESRLGRIRWTPTKDGESPEISCQFKWWMKWIKSKFTSWFCGFWWIKWCEESNMVFHSHFQDAAPQLATLVCKPHQL